MNRLRAAVVGATGWAGGELCRLLLNHPAIAEILPVSKSDRSFELSHPGLLGCGLKFYDLKVALDAPPEVAFLALPSGQSFETAARLLELGVRVIDLSPDHRFTDSRIYQEVYGIAHKAPELAATAVYGLPEFNSDEIGRASLVANPGCYATAAILATAPFLSQPMLPETARLDFVAINGTTGAPSEGNRALHHARVHNTMMPYTMSGHRHAPEIAHVLERFFGSRRPASLVTAHGPFPRGILLIATLEVGDGCFPDLNKLTDEMIRFYADRPFVRVRPAPASNSRVEKNYDMYPQPAHVYATNFCHIAIDFDQERQALRTMAVLDNLGKGAAGGAIQNMNIMFGLPETAGLSAYAP